MAVKDTYSNYNAKQYDYTSQYDVIGKPEQVNTHVVERNRLDFDPDDSLPIWHTRPPMDSVKSMTFRYQIHKTSNSNDRDQIYYGSVDCGVNIMLWGFPSYQEFRDHLAVCDKATARDLWEQIKCDFAGTSTRFVFWVGKLDSQDTQPGCWAITIQSAVSRDMFVYANQDLNHYGPLKLSKQNKIHIDK